MTKGNIDKLIADLDSVYRNAHTNNVLRETTVYHDTVERIATVKFEQRGIEPELSTQFVEGMIAAAAFLLVLKDWVIRDDVDRRYDQLVAASADD